MSTKSHDRKKNKDCAGRWTKEEVEKFAEIQSEPSNNYVVTLGRLPLKKSSNNEVSECVKKSFDEALQDSGFIESNERNNFMNKNNTVKSSKNIETSIEKLRIKFKSFKREWSKIQRRIKNSSGLASDKEPQ